MRIVTTGGRDFADRELVRWALALLNPREVGHGACHTGTLTRHLQVLGLRICGADGVVDETACGIGSNVERYPVDVAIDGPWPAAGPRRNQRMLDSFRPDLVLAFPGGKGTADCCRKAEKMGIRVITARGGSEFVLMERLP